jgi:hypothetical protein
MYKYQFFILFHFLREINILENDILFLSKVNVT